MQKILKYFPVCIVATSGAAFEVRRNISPTIGRHHARATSYHPCILITTCPIHSVSHLQASQGSDDGAESNKKKEAIQKRRKSGNKNSQSKNNDGFRASDEADKARKKDEIAKAAAQLKLVNRKEDSEASGIFEKLNPFQAGKKLRKTVEGAITSLSRASGGPGVSSRQGSIYYLDDRFQESGGALFNQETNPYLSRLEQDNYVPEILVVGATGEVGRLVVRRLLLEGRSQVRVLVRDLFSKTLNLLGTGVTYCQGDLANMDSLEYALTDVDKIVMCAAAPRPDEKGFQEKFKGFAKDNLRDQEPALITIEFSTYKQGATDEEVTESDMEWERRQSVLEVRARLAEQVDLIGMQNLVKAYQNVRHADYGTSQAAKRSLFKFSESTEDFNLFVINDEDVASTGKTDGAPAPTKAEREQSDGGKQADYYDFTIYSDNYDEYEDFAEDEWGPDEDADAYAYKDKNYVEDRADSSVKAQCKWVRNVFGHGVFVGKVPKPLAGGVGGEASIISGRLRSRDGEVDEGIDLSGFGGLICRVCSDGGVYEAFVRTSAYESSAIEYIAQFHTATKPTRRGNASRNKFVTIRLPFEQFKPVRRQGVSLGRDDVEIDVFRGQDVRHVGFRCRSASNANTLRSRLEGSAMSSFYLALSYIKLFRSQPEPEFVYLSDGRIPPIVKEEQINHGLRQITLADEFSGEHAGVQIFDEKAMNQATGSKMGRSPEETYFKFMGEEILKNSGLSYAIIRVSEFNENPSSEASAIDLKTTNEGVIPVSRADCAAVVTNALLEPAALNKICYISRKAAKTDENITEKFKKLT